MVTGPFASDEVCLTRNCWSGLPVHVAVPMMAPLLWFTQRQCPSIGVVIVPFAWNCHAVLHSQAWPPASNGHFPSTGRGLHPPSTPTFAPSVEKQPSICQQYVPVPGKPLAFADASCTSVRLLSPGSSHCCSGFSGTHSSAHIAGPCPAALSAAAATRDSMVQPQLGYSVSSTRVALNWPGRAQCLPVE